MRIDFDGTKAQRGMDAIAMSYDLVVKKRQELAADIKATTADIKKLKEDLKSATTQAQKDSINAQILAKKEAIEATREEDKRMKSSEKMLKEMQKRTSITYRSIMEDLKNISHLTIHEIELNMRQLDARLKNYKPDTKYGRKMIDQTRNAMAAFEAELKGRNRGMAGASNYFRPFSEIMADFKNKPQSISTIKALREEMERLYNSATSQTTRNSAVLGLKEMDEALTRMSAKPIATSLRSLIDQFDSMEKGSNITGLRALREEVERFKLNTKDADQIKGAVKLIGDIDKQLEDMTKLPKRPVDVVLGELAKEKSIEGLERLKNEINALFRSSTDKGDQQKLAQGLRDVDAAIKKIGESPKRPLGDIMKDIDAAMKNGSLERLEALRVEIGNVFRSLSDQSEAQKARAKMEQLDLVIKNFGKETIDAFAVLKNPQNFNLSQIEAAIKQLDQMLQNTNVGPAFERRRAFLAEQIRSLNEYKKAYEESLKAPKMSSGQASDIANGAVTATVGQLKEAKEALEAFKQTLKTTDVTGLEKVNQEIKAIDKMLDDVNGKTKKVMDASQAHIAIQNAKALIETIRVNPGTVTADYANEVIDAVKRAQSAQHISVQTSQEAVAVERALTEAMKGKNVAVISAAEAARAEANATQILIDKKKADADTVRDTIELYKQMLLQGGMTIERRTQLSKQLEQMEKLYKGTADAASKLAYDEAFVNKTLANIKTAPVKDLETAMKMLKQKMSEVNRETEAEVKEYVRLRQEYNKTKSALDALNGTKQKAAKQTKTLSTRIKEQTDAISRATGKLMQYLGVFGGFYLIRNQMEKVFEANMRYDDSLTNIRKTTQMTSEAVAVLANEIKHIDTRTSVEEMTNLAYAAGKLGVKGVSDVLSFVRAADQIKVALGEQLGDGAAAVEQIYKVANVMGDIDQYGMENALEKVGSSINYLTMQTQATAQPMIDMMKRLAGVGRQAGMSTADLVGWAGATNALGQNTELAATALSRVMVQLSKNHKAVAQALNMTEEETRDFRYDISTGRISEAMLKVLQMGKERGGLSQLGLIIKDLSGSDGARAIQVLSTLSSNYETVASMVRMSNNAFEEGTSVTDEYNLKQQNTTALLEKLKNGFAKLFVSHEYTEYINNLLRKMQDLPEAMNRVVHSLSWLGAIFKGVIATITTFTSLFEGMANGLVWRMLSQGVLALSGAYTSFKHTVHDASKALEVHRNVIRGHHTHVAMLTKGYTGWQLSIRKVRLEWGALVKGFKAMGTAGMLNVIFLVATAVTTVWTAIKNVREESQKWTRSFQEDLGRIEAQSKITTASLNKIDKAWKDAGDSELQHKDILIELNSTYGAFIDNLIDEKTKYEDIAKAIKAANAELENKAILEARQNKINEIEEKSADELNNKINASLKRIVQLATFEREIEEKDKNGKVTTKKVTVGYKDMSAVEKQASAASIETAVQTVLGDTALIKKLYAAAPSDIDEFGRATKYGIKGEMNASNGLITIDKEARENLKLLFRDLGIADTNENWKEVLYAMQGAVNVQTNIQNTQDDAMRAYNGKARAVTNATYDDTMDLVKKSWLDVVDSVTKDGKYAFSRYTAEDEEVRRGDRKEGEAKPYHGKEQDDYYSDVKEAFGTTRKGLEERKKLEEKLERFIENAQRGVALLESRRYTDAAAQQQYDQLSYQLQSAQAELKVVRIGQIDNVVPKGAAASAARDAKQEMDNLIQKIKTFYEIQANAYNEMRHKQQITETEYQRYLEQNNRDMSASLADAYAALAQDADMTEERYKQITERMRQENKRSGAGEIGATQIGIVSGTSYASVQNINRQLSGDKENGTAWTNSMRRKRREEEGNIIESLNKEMQARIKAWLEQNPLGKIAQDFQKQFEEIGLLIHIKPEVNADGVEIRNLTQVEDDLMKQMLEIGKHVSEYSVTTDEGRQKFAEYVKDMEKFPDVAKTAVLKTTSDVESFYYKAYEYAEQYQEQIQKLAEKQIRIWKKMFDAKEVKLQSDVLQDALSQLMKQQERMTKFGFSDRHQLDSNVLLQREKLTQATMRYYEMKEKAEAQMAAAQALNIDEMDGDVKINASYKQKKIDQAQGVLDDLKKQADEVNQIYQALGDAIMAVQDKNLEFLASLSQSFGKFADAFTPLREFYDERDNWWEHVFGSKEERQEAFASFVMDLKKTTKEMIMEDVRQRITAVMNEKMKQKQLSNVRQAAYTEEQVQERVQLAVKEALGRQEVSIKQGIIQQEMNLDQQQQQQEMQNTAADVQGKGAGFIAKAIGWCYEHFGPIGGSVAAGLVTAAIGSAINWALNLIGHQSHGLNANGASKVKLVSGMLTYDSGNVQSFPVMGDDGRVYMASRGGVPSSGTGIVTRPTLTTVGGAPALVAERGPEMVIGRETTHAMMMSRPDLLRAIVEFDRNRSRGFAKTFDSGNVSQIAAIPESSSDGNNQQLMEVLDAQTAMLSQMYEINSALTAEIRKGIGVRKYGAGGLVEETAAGLVEARRMGNNKNVTRLFGK